MIQVHRGISEVSFLRLIGEYVSDGGTRCDVIGCEALAICLVGGGCDHPSCERHAQGESYHCALHGEEDGEKW